MKAIADRLRASGRNSKIDVERLIPAIRDAEAK
jgi:hypothetical protein